MMADDIDCEIADNPYSPYGFRDAFFVILLACAVVDVPLSWGKLRGGLVLEWIGYTLILSSYKVGVSERRAEWCVKWCHRVREGVGINTSELEEGVGRLNFVAGILDHPRPWLAPLYSFLSSVPRNSIVVLPPFVRLALRYLAHSFASCRLVPCARSLRPFSSSLRVDAHAEGSKVGVGAWLPHVDKDGRPHKDKSAWLSVCITPDNAPWAFEKAGHAFRVIATLEAFAIVLGIKYLVPDVVYGDASSFLTVVPCLTDNQGNGRALTKLFTTRHPLAAVVMELGEELRHRDMIADVSWAPRDTNEEADALSRGVSDGFDPALRIEVDLATVPWRIFGEALRWGQDLADEVAARRAGGGPRLQRRPARKRPRGERLRARDPW